MAIVTRPSVHSNGDIDAYVSVVGSLGIMLCMIFSLIGIKLWWFKHRLTFEQSSTSNGAAGGAQPSVAPPPKRTSRDKRLSQQFHDADMVHGVFRKRQEEDLTIERPRELPPVRVEKLYAPATPKSKALASTLPRMSNLEYPMPPPPTRQPPRPPVHGNEMPQSSQPTPQTTTTTTTTMPIFQKVQMHAPTRRDLDSISMPALPNEFDDQQQRTEQAALHANPPKPPKRLIRSQSSDVHSDGDGDGVAVAGAAVGGRTKFLKAKSPSEPESMRDLAQRRPTGYLRPPEGNLREMQENFGALSVDEFGGPPPSDGYVRYEQYDAEGLQGITDEWRRRQPDGAYTGEPSANDCHGMPFEDGGRALSTTTLADRRADEFYWVKGEGSDSQSSWHEPDGPAKLVTFQYDDDNDIDREDSRSPLKIRRPTGYVRDTDFEMPRSVTFANGANNDDDDDDDEDGVESPLKLRRPTAFERNLEWDLPRAVTFAEEGEATKADDRESPFQVRRPTGYPRRPNEIQFESDNDDEAELAREKHMWLELERPPTVDGDFSVRVEEEFNKIRMSYDRSAADVYLDVDDEFGKLHAMRGATRPSGYGKSIDEDWASFEELQSKKRNDNDDDHSERLAGQAPKTVKFEASTWAGVESDRFSNDERSSPQRRPTGYVSSFDELLLVTDGACGAAATQHATRADIFGEYHDSDSDNGNGALSIRERRPTGYAKRSSGAASEWDDDKVEPKPRQKVTFDFNAEEHYLPDYAGDGADESGEEHESSAKLPQPMQRLTKIRYTDDTHNRPLLFGTHLDSDDAAASLPATDSWSAIRQHRNLTEEFQLISLAAPDEATARQPMPRNLEPPKPAYRNPLAQLRDDSPQQRRHDEREGATEA